MISKPTEEKAQEALPTAFEASYANRFPSASLERTKDEKTYLWEYAEDAWREWKACTDHILAMLDRPEVVERAALPVLRIQQPYGFTEEKERKTALRSTEAVIDAIKAELTKGAEQ